MSQINPFTASLLGTPMAQRQASAERDAEVRRARRALKIGTAEDVPLDEFVESADAVDAVDNDTRRESDAQQRQPKPKKKPDEDRPHVDVKA